MLYIETKLLGIKYTNYKINIIYFAIEETSYISDSRHFFVNLRFLETIRQQMWNHRFTQIENPGEGMFPQKL